MIILGFSGGPNAIHEKTFEVFPGAMHDAAAVLLEHGEVVAAIEQERLDRIKHSNKGSFDAIRFCLDTAGRSLAEVDRLVFYGERSYWDWMLRRHYLEHLDQAVLTDSQSLMHAILTRELGPGVAPGQPLFVGHHLAHAVSAAAMSGFDESLVLTIDGQGDDIAGGIYLARGCQVEPLATLPVAKSLGYFYLGVISFLGYRIFDEYKVMGLAPYGDPDRYRELFKTFYTLEPDGQYSLAMERLRSLFDIVSPRRPSAPILQVHQDIAAALQQSLEEIVFHVLRHYRQATGQRHLCLAGGVAHNCTLNGKILRSGLFDDVFVQPASHDAGCALGAALHVDAQEAKRSVRPRLRHVYWGTDVGGTDEVEAELRLWEPFVEIEKVPDPCAAAAELLAQGQVLGWVQGRSEFGPRALGNRSIVADPRPAENKDIINAMVKKREAFRPFAPSVLEERVDEFFDLPAGTRLPFMVFTVSVREDKRPLLGAITHVDGSARIQTVSRDTNERYWRLIDEFRRRTGVAVLLNTSFNNNAEPIVDSVRDAMVCFLTTKLHGLVAGDFVVRKRDVPWMSYLKLIPALPRHVEVQKTLAYSPESGWSSSFRVGSNTQSRHAKTITRPVFELLEKFDGKTSLEDLLLSSNDAAWSEAEGVVQDVLDLWSSRLITLAPTAVVSASRYSEARTLLGQA
jgi:carbamoyltransferase